MHKRKGIPRQVTHVNTPGERIWQFTVGAGLIAMWNIADRALPHMWFVSVLFGMAGWVGIAMFLTSFFPKWTEETWDDDEETARYTRSQRAARVIVGVGLWGLCALGALTIGTPLIPVYTLAAFIGLFLVVDALHGWYYPKTEAEWEAPKSAPEEGRARRIPCAEVDGAREALRSSRWRRSVSSRRERSLVGQIRRVRCLLRPCETLVAWAREA